MATVIKTCIVCGKKYEYCNSCSSYRHVEAWHNIYHDENCRRIFNTAANYHAGMISADEAKDEFKKCDLSNKKTIKPSIAQLIDELLKESEEVQPEKVEQEEKVVVKKRGNRVKVTPVDETLNGDL